MLIRHLLVKLVSKKSQHDATGREDDDEDGTSQYLIFDALARVVPIAVAGTSRRVDCFVAS